MLINDTKIFDILNHCSPNTINFFLIAENTTLDINELIREATEKDIKIAGGIFPMIIHNERHLQSGIILKKFPADSKLSLVKNISHANTIFELPELDESINSCMILVDGLTNNLSTFLDSLYEKYWNKINYVGAGCGSMSLEQSPCVFTNEGLFQNAAIVLLIENEIALGVNHGYDKICGPFIANKVEGNKVIELNWRPAFEVYQEEIEKQSDQRINHENFFEISKDYPFGIHKEGNEDIVRDPLLVDEKGGITCIGEVSANVSLNLLRGNKKTLVESAGRAAKLAMKDITPLDIFVVDCITRALYLENEFKKELEAVKKVLDSKSSSVMVEGVLSLGEISTGKGGFLELYNKTIVVSATHLV